MTSVVVDDPGSGYSSAPSLELEAVPGGGSTATADAVFEQARPAVPAHLQNMVLEVPILTMLPIPIIRIEETTIDFDATIHSVEEVKTDESFKPDASLDATVKYPPLFSVASAKLEVPTSFRKNTQAGTTADRTCSMAVHLRAVQDEMPAGMEKILGILEDAIEAQPAKAPAPVES